MLNLYTLEKSIAKHMQAAQVPGLALAVLQDGELIYAGGFGVTSVEDGGIAVTPQTLFRIGSTTRALTGTALMRLVERKLLDLDLPVTAYLDWLKFREPGAEKSMTLRTLLSHTSGLPIDTPIFEQRNTSGLEAFLRHEIPKYPLVAPPGKLFTYSNLNIIIAGYIAQTVYGKSYTEMMKDLLFDPLHMQRTTFDPTVAMTYPLAQSHSIQKDGTLAVEHRYLENTASYPSDFAMSTALDMAQFALLHLNGGYIRETTVLESASIAAMQQSQTQLFTRKDLHYGLTFSIEQYRGRRLIGHEGAIGSFGCQFALLPDDAIGAVLLYNRLDLDSTGIIHSIFDRLLSTSQRRVKSRPQSRVASGRASWPAYIGNYLSPYIGLVDIKVVNNQLLAEIDDECFPLHPVRKHFYTGKRGDSDQEITIGFVQEDRDPVQYIVVNPYGDNSVFHLLECKRVVLNDDASDLIKTWQAYTGTYHHPELGTYTLTLSHKKPVLELQEEQEQAACIPLDQQQFVCRWGLFAIQIDANGSTPCLIHQGHMLTLQRIVDKQTELVEISPV